MPDRVFSQGWRTVRVDGRMWATFVKREESSSRPARAVCKIFESCSNDRRTWSLVLRWLGRCRRSAVAGAVRTRLVARRPREALHRDQEARLRAREARSREAGARVITAAEEAPRAAVRSAREERAARSPREARPLPAETLSPLGAAGWVAEADQVALSSVPEVALSRPVVAVAEAERARAEALPAPGGASALGEPAP